MTEADKSFVEWYENQKSISPKKASDYYKNHYNEIMEKYKRKALTNEEKMDTTLALKLNKVVHNECKDVPHDIGIRLEQIAREYANQQLAEKDKHIKGWINVVSKKDERIKELEGALAEYHNKTQEFIKELGQQL